MKGSKPAIRSTKNEVTHTKSMRYNATPHTVSIEEVILIYQRWPCTCMFRLIEQLSISRDCLDGPTFSIIVKAVGPRIEILFEDAATSRAKSYYEALTFSLCPR